MPDIASRGRRSSAAVRVEHGRMQSHGVLLDRKGAGMLLVLLVLVIVLGVVRLRTAEAQQMVQSTANSQSSVQQLTPAEEEKAMVIESIEVDNPNVNQMMTADIQVNGKPVPVPESGEAVHQETVENNGTKTTVDVRYDSSTTGSSVQSWSTLNLSVQSDQVSESEKE